MSTCTEAKSTSGHLAAVTCHSGPAGRAVNGPSALRVQQHTRPLDSPGKLHRHSELPQLRAGPGHGHQRVCKHTPEQLCGLWCTRKDVNNRWVRLSAFLLLTVMCQKQVVRTVRDTQRCLLSTARTGQSPPTTYSPMLDMNAIASSEARGSSPVPRAPVPAEAPTTVSSSMVMAGFSHNRRCSELTYVCASLLPLHRWDFC